MWGSRHLYTIQREGDVFEWEKDPQTVCFSWLLEKVGDCGERIVFRRFIIDILYVDSLSLLKEFLCLHQV